MQQKKKLFINNLQDVIDKNHTAWEEKLKTIKAKLKSLQTENNEKITEFKNEKLALGEYKKHLADIQNNVLNVHKTINEAYDCLYKINECIENKTIMDVLETKSI